MKGERLREQIHPTELQNCALAEVQLTQNSPFEGKVLLGSGTWEHLVSLLQICPSKWDVDIPDKLMGETN